MADMSSEGYDVGGAIALYDPNGPMAIIAFLVFLAVAAGLWYRHFKTSPRAMYMRPVRYGATFMAIGYLCRFTRRNGINAWSWLFETLFILLSPCAFLAQVYLLLPRIATALDMESALPLSGRAIKWIFIVADVTTVFAQLAGTALTITFGDLVKIGRWIVTAGLWVQLAFFLSFMVIFGIFSSRIRKNGYRLGGLAIAGEPGVGVGGTKWTKQCRALLGIMYGVCLCLFVRSIYRVAEYTAGGNSALAHSEVAFYILDALPMLLIILAFLIVWAPACLESHALPLTLVEKRNQPIPARNSLGLEEGGRGVPMRPVPVYTPPSHRWARAH